ncbi:HSP20-like chaperone [Cantharellus anzutake]|uniref:HSP20-like chaperone n=1 Tax=Cantharellus anzutake TaxID=1750568 RepID=UPI001907E4B6|nr:HSP20-like chaperone [Cantharellus anzutake]KAF8344052.1 HSP20-like chaperone [Cantharellus anzutake]
MFDVFGFVVDLIFRLDLIDGEGNTMVATFELPGLKKEDVHIEIDDQNKLIVTGESRLSEETDRDGYIFRERRVGRFKRVLDVPPGTEVDEIGAHLSDGVLTVTFPKTSRAELPRRKRITISS